MDGRTVPDFWSEICWSGTWPGVWSILEPGPVRGPDQNFEKLEKIKGSFKIFRKMKNIPTDCTDETTDRTGSKIIKYFGPVRISKKYK